MESTDSLKKSTLVVATIGSFITPFMASSVNVALPYIAKSFKIDAVLLSWIATCFLLAAGVALVPSGRLGDIYGRKRLLAWGFGLFSISSILCATAFSAHMLILFRVMQGIGCGMIFATSPAILMSVFSPKERGRVLGITVAAVYIGLSSGPFIGGVLTLHLSWRSLFLLNGLFGFAVVGIILVKLKGEWAEARGERFDMAGTFIYGLALTAIIYGLSLLPSLKSLWLILAGIIGGVFFVRWESSIKFPVFEVSLFRKNRVFALSNLAALIQYSATFAVTFLLSLYFQYIKGFDPQTTGLILISQPITMALFSPFAGKLSDKVEPRIIATLGMSITCVMLFFLSFIRQDTGLFYIIPCLLILGFGYALFSSPNMNAIMSSVEKRFLGIASGSAGTMRVLGQMLSMGLATLVLSIFMGREQITEALYPNLLQSINICYIILCVICVSGIFASLARGDVRGY
jgi:EmrB/QacA subfamily drug resistance transporter